MKANTLVLAAMLVVALSSTALAEEYKIDKAHSHALYRVKHLGTSWSFGSIPDIAGSVSFNAEKSEASSMAVTLKPASIMTWVQRRDNHLAGPDFFNSKEFPTITFKSTSWEKTGDKRYKVAGDFTLLGVTRKVTAEVEQVGSGVHPRSGRPLIGFYAEFTIDRTEFGMNYGVSEDGSGLGRDVKIMFAIEAVQR